MKFPSILMIASYIKSAKINFGFMVEICFRDGLSFKGALNNILRAGDIIFETCIFRSFEGNFREKNLIEDITLYEKRGCILFPENPLLIV